MINTFQLLDSYLAQQLEFWRVEPFHQSRDLSFPWVETHPLLCQWLSSLEPEDIIAFKKNTQQLIAASAPYIDGICTFTEACKLQTIPSFALQLPRQLETGVPGRKQEQILAMGSAVLTEHKASEWLEWCSGKGYLGRVLTHQSKQNVTSFEFQQALCEKGQQEANDLKLKMHFVQGDAFSSEARSVFNSNQHAVALHACGDLHVSLMRHAIDARLPQISFSPCCYHLVQGESYQPLSNVGKRALLRLSKSDLRIPLQETVTGGARVERHRQQEMTYRLGFDLLLKNEFAHSHYVSVPSIKKSLLSDGFEAFCCWAADKKDINLEDNEFERNYAYYEQEGVKRFWHMERLSLIQQMFRRPLEMWLIYDKALYLKEHGYQVSINEFCRREATPRNILVQARLIHRS